MKGATLIAMSPDVWLGNRDDALNKKFLMKNNITCVVNCTRDLLFRENAGVTQQYRLALDDHPDDIDIMTKRLPGIVNKIGTARRNGQNILIHCRQGAQRSCAVTASYLLTEAYNSGLTQLTVQDMIDFVKDLRSEAFRPKVNFKASLLKYQRWLQNKLK